MLERFLAFGSMFDWISPVLAGLQDLANGPSHTFMVPFGQGWSGREVARLLKRHGIESWGHMIVNGDIMLTVREPQARWAQYVLDQAGVPLSAGAVVTSSRSPARQEKAPSLLESLDTWLGGLGDLLG